MPSEQFPKWDYKEYPKTLSARRSVGSGEKNRLWQTGAGEPDPDDGRRHPFWSGIAPKSVLLDIGCGNAALVARLFPYFDQCLGVDSSEYLISVANARFGSPRHTFVCEDAVEYAMREPNPLRFDRALCFGMFAYLSDEAARQLLTCLGQRFLNLALFSLGAFPIAIARTVFSKRAAPAGADLDNPHTQIGVWRTQRAARRQWPRKAAGVPSFRTCHMTSIRRTIAITRFSSVRNDTERASNEQLRQARTISQCLAASHCSIPSSRRRTSSAPTSIGSSPIRACSWTVVLFGRGEAEKLLDARLADFHHVRHCISFCSGFWALVLTIRCLALKDKSEVVMPSLTYRRLADIVAWTGLTPHLCEVDPASLCMTAQTARSCINQNTALILGVHPIVNCCDAEGLEALSAEVGIPLVFDAVESVYETVNGRKVGSFGLAECFSLHASKLLNGFEGGYVTTNDDALAEHLRALRTNGIGEGGLPAPAMNAVQNEIHAAMALAALDNVDEQVDANRRRYRRYQDRSCNRTWPSADRIR